MAYRHYLSLLFFIGIILLPIVSYSADDFCDILSEVAEDAPSRFKSIRGPKDSEFFYQSKISLPHADECLVDIVDGEFICWWKVGLKDNPKKSAETLADGIKECFPAAKYRSSSIKRIAAHVYTVGGITFRVGFNEDRNKVRLGIERVH